MAGTRNPKLYPEATALTVRLRSGELWISSVDGWNDDDEILMAGPLFSEARRLWYVKSEEIMAYAEQLTPAEEAEAVSWGFRT